MLPPLILLVDDDPHIRDVVRFALQKAGMRTLEACNGQAALALLEQQTPDLIVLDILMPELDGLEVCRRIRATRRLPIVFLSSRDEELDRILGLELGGDDYLTKPFSPRELVARVKAVLRRMAPPEQTTVPATPAALQHGRLVLDLERCVVRVDAQELVLTATELHLLRTFLQAPNKVFSREALMDHVYKDEVVVSDRTIDSHIRRVRRKLEPLGIDPILTLHGLGYRLADKV